MPERVKHSQVDNYDLERSWLDMESQHPSHLLNADPKREDEMFMFLPFSDLRTWIYDDELAFSAINSMGIWRLHGIRQLSFLAYVGPHPETQYLMAFDHTRLEHTLQVVKIGEAILKRNNASKDDIVLATVAFAAHDKETPAWGDAIKKIDPQGLNEEDAWRRNVNGNEKRYIERLGLTVDQIDDVIHNRGVIGGVLDLADRMSYVMLDLSQLMSAEHLNTLMSAAEDLGYREEIAKVLREDTNVGSIYRDVVIDWEKGDAYFVNPERLRRFLEIRALLNKYLYLHPVSQARDMIVANLVAPYYSSDDKDSKVKLTPKVLRKITDHELLVYLSQKHPELEQSVYASVGVEFSMDHALQQWYPQFWEAFRSREEMDVKRQALEADGMWIRGSVESRGFNPLTHYKVMTDEGVIMSFREYDPDCAGRIERIADDTKGHFLFWEEKGRELYPRIPLNLE